MKMKDEGRREGNGDILEDHYSSSGAAEQRVERQLGGLASVREER